MTIRNLEAAFAPRSIAVIGASERAGSVGAVVLTNILAAGFNGAIYPVNLKYDNVQGCRCYRRIADLPEAPDLAVIMTPPASVPTLVAELGERGTRAAVVITAGIGPELRQAMLDAARPHLLRIIGPNTIGLLAPRVGLNASFANGAAMPGHLGLISQSGAIVSSVIDWASAAGIGFSHVLSLGDMADVDIGDALNMLAADDQTSAILIYLESIPAPRKFMSAARAAARIKPVIAVKPGRHAASAKAALTHTGALSGADKVVDAALQRAGIIRVDDLQDLFNAAEITARFKPLSSGRVAIITNGGGAGVLAVDQLLDQDATLATLSPETIAALDQVLPPTWSHANPVDIIGDAPPARYAAAIEAVSHDIGVDALLVMTCPTALASPVDAAEAVAAITRNSLVNGKPVLACWLGGRSAQAARDVLHRAGIASFNTPAEAAEAVALLTRWSDLRATLERVPASREVLAVDRRRAQAVFDGVATQARTMLTEAEAKEVAAAYGIPVAETLIAADPDGVAKAATQVLQTNKAVVVKLLSRAGLHKSDLGGVVLNLETAEAAREAAAGIRDRLAASSQSAALDGFTVQPMIDRPFAEELIAGIHTDPIFGPVVLVGAGGTGVEIIGDTATGLVPLDAALAGTMLNRTRISRLLAGYRDHPPADRPAILRALLGLSQLAIDFACLKSVDINPLLADAAGVIALDARIEIDPALVGVTTQNSRLAIRPYPSGWDKNVSVPAGTYLLRPVRPADADLYPEFLRAVTSEDLRRRFLYSMRTLSPEMLVRLTQLDYDRDIAFIALDEKTSLMAGIARYSSDPDRETAEFGVLVRSDLKGGGLGTALMNQLIAHARAEGLKHITGSILRDNTSMLSVGKDLGFVFKPDPDDTGLVLADLALL